MKQRYTVQCACGHRMRVKMKHIGRLNRCTRCREPVLVSYESVSPPITPFTPDAPRFFSEDEVPVHWRKGDRFMDLYEVVDFLGEGGMGVVYRVRHKGWHTDLAVKTPKPALLPKDLWKDTFERECATWVNLDEHPNIVKCHYVRRLGGLPRIFMEYVPGGTLYKWIYNRTLYQGDERQTLLRVLDIAIQSALGLAFAHERGLTHHDVKPSNLLVTHDGMVKVSDFSLVHALGSLGEIGNADANGAKLARGTAPYCAPEEHAAETMFHKADMWSWAATVLEMFAGRLSWADAQGIHAIFDALAAGGNGDPEAAPALALPSQVADIMRACFEPEPEARPASMGDVARTLQDLYEDIAGAPFEHTVQSQGLAHADTFNNRAVSLLDLGDVPEAEALWEKALTETPSHPESNYNYLLHRWRSGHIRDDEFLRQLQAIGAGKGQPWLYRYLLACVLIERGDASAALDVLRSIGAPNSDQREVLYAIAIARDRADSSRRLIETLHGHEGAILSVCLGSGGWYGLTGNDNGIISHWDLTARRCVRTIEAHEGRIQALCMSRDEHRAFSGGKDGLIRVWNLNTGKCIQTIDAHENAVRSLQLSDDQQVLLSGGQDHLLRLWDVRSGECVKIGKGHDAGVNAAAMSGCGRFAVSGGRDRTVRYWDLQTGRCLRVFSGHDNRIHAVCLSRNRQIAISGSRDATIRIWNVATGRCLRVLRGHQSEVYSLCLSPSEEYLLSGSRCGTLRLWDLKSGQCVRSYQGAAPVALSPDGRVALSAGYRGELKIWVVASGLKRIPAPFMICAAQPTHHTDHPPSKPRPTFEIHLAKTGAEAESSHA